MLAGAALAAAPAAARADEAPRYPRLPVIARDWTKVAPEPGVPDPVGREQQRQAEAGRRWHAVHEMVGANHLSRRAAASLAGRGLGAALVAGDGAKSASYDGIDTLRVLLVRVSFDTNRSPSLTTIPADGDFMLTPAAEPEPIPIDPAPHDRTYFEAHLRGLSEYYRYQSGGRLHIEGRVLPEDPVGSYKLSDIADYGPGSSGFWTLESLERLVRDFITAADEGTPADGVDLGDYDDHHPFTYVIFVHAGSDWQSDIYGDSPNDIPTFFISLGEPQPLRNGELSECSIIPETTSQDDYPGSIAAALYHEFGHALGLPDVYSTYTGYPSVGIWDLMDSGTNLPVVLATITDQGDTVATVATGVLPPSLSAWCRWFLGWLEVEELQNRTGDIYLPGAGVPREQYPAYRAVNLQFREEHPQALRCGISPREWFLAENRWVPAGPAETPYSELYFERDEASGVIEYLSGLRQGVYQNTGLYDYFMPAGGVLVWHVNMDRIEAGLQDNTINIAGDGLRLVEADGIQDIGVLDAYVMGWTGSVLDPFGGYMFDQFGNRLENEYRTLGADGFPNTRGYDRSWSGLHLDDVRMNGFNGGVMRFSAGIDSVPAGFPFETDPVGEVEAAARGGAPGARGIDPASLTVVTAGAAPVLIFADAAPAGWSGAAWPTGLNGLTASGAPRWGAAAGRPFSEFLQLTAPLAGAPVAWTEDDGSARLLCGTTDGVVTFVTIPASGQPAVTWTTDLGAPLAAAPRLLRDETGAAAVVCAVQPEQLVRLALADGAAGTPVPALGVGEIGPAFAGEPVVLADLAGDRLVVPQGTALGVFDARAAALQPGLRLPYGRDVHGALQAVASADADDPRIAVYDSLGLVGAWLPDGTPAGAPDPGAALVAAPAVADLDADGRLDLVLATGARVLAARTDGTPLRGFPAALVDMFPLPDTTSLAGPLLVADLDGDGLGEIVAVTDGGHLLSLTSTGRLRPGFPRRTGDRVAAGLAVGAGPTAGTGRRLWLASAGGYAGPPFDRDLTGGRLTALRLAPATADEAHSSEWLALGGGALRGGPVGEARSLGAASPVAAEQGQVMLYPNPVTGSDVTVRLAAAADGTARLTLYTLEGEPVADASFAVAAGVVTEHALAVPAIASGLYVCRVSWPSGSGHDTRTLTLAVER